METCLARHSDFLSRQVTILLRKQFTRNSFNSDLQGLPTLSRVVLRLRITASSENDPALCDAIRALLKQLDISWMDSDRKLTTEILRVIAIFIYDFTRLSLSTSTEKAKNEKLRVASSPKGALTTLVKGGCVLTICLE